MVLQRGGDGGHGIALLTPADRRAPQLWSTAVAPMRHRGAWDRRQWWSSVSAAARKRSTKGASNAPALAGGFGTPLLGGPVQAGAWLVRSGRTRGVDLHTAALPAHGAMLRSTPSRR